MRLYLETEGSIVKVKSEFGETVLSIKAKNRIVSRIVGKLAVKFLDLFDIEAFDSIFSNEQFQSALRRFSLQVLLREAFMGVFVENKVTGERCEFPPAIISGITDGNVIHVAAPREFVKHVHTVKLQLFKELPAEAGPPRMLGLDEHPGDVMMKWRDREKELKREKDEARGAGSVLGKVESTNNKSVVESTMAPPKEKEEEKDPKDEASNKKSASKSKSSPLLEKMKQRMNKK